MGFSLSGRSKRNLEEVHHHLKLLATEAIKITRCDFMVYEGLRTTEQQRAYCNAGVSRTMQSRHLPARYNGLAHAVDLVPIVGGVMRWEWEPCYAVADAMRTVALREEIPLRWGGCWDMLLTDTVTKDAKEMAFGYAKRQIARGEVLFADGPHFELPRTLYPD